MKKSTLAFAVGMALGGASLSAQAALNNSAVLQFTAGNVGGFTDSASAGVSWFSFQISPTTNIYTGLQPGLDGGIHIGAPQPLPPGVYTHSGNPYGGTYTTDIGAIDAPWSFLIETGLHFTNSPVNVVTDSGTTKTLSFSGWNVSWNGIPAISMSGGMQVVSSVNTTTKVTSYTTYNNGTGLATITCSASSCSNTSSFTLDYAATVAQNDWSGFGGVNYGLHLTGHVSSVPVPAAAWLFGSGLAGLAGRRRVRKQEVRSQ